MGYLIPYPRWANWPFVTDSGFMLMGVGAALSPPLPGNSDTPFPSGILGLMALPVCLQISISLATVRRGQALYCMLMPRCKRMKIGRASCREREEDGVGGGGAKRR